MIWSEPLQPNAQSLEYELARMKIREPLNRTITFPRITKIKFFNISYSATPEGLNSWSTIYRGNKTYYEDRKLTLFTTYRYRVTSYNDYGHVISSPSVEVTTFGGKPKKPPTVKVVVITHFSIQVSWTIPGDEKIKY